MKKKDKELKRKATAALKRIPNTATRVLDRIEAREEMSDAKLMLEIFRQCILLQIIPSRRSPCHKRLKKIMRNMK